MMFGSQNPWTESPAAGLQAAIARVMAAASAAHQVSERFPATKPSLSAFGRDAQAIIALWETHPDIYRRQRTFAAVEIPDLHLFFTGLVKQGGELDQAVLPALEVVTDRARMRRLEAEEASRPDLPDSIPSQPVQTPQEPEIANGFLGRVGRIAQTAGTKSKTYATSAVNAATAAGQAGFSLASHSLSWTDASVRGYAGENLTPVRATLSALRSVASGTTLLMAAGSFLQYGLLASILFPPAIPVAVGLSLMEAAATAWETGYDKAEKEQNSTTQAHQERRDEAARQMAAILGRASAEPQVFGTDHIHMAIDPTTGQMDGRILTGRHAGQRLAALSAEERQALIRHAPDPTTRAILELWRS